MDRDELHEYLRDLFANAGHYDADDIRATVENAYEELLGYDVATMDDDDERLGYWEDRLADDLDADSFIPTFLDQAETDPGTHVGAADFAANVLAVRAAREEAEAINAAVGDPPADAASEMADVNAVASGARDDALDLTPAQQDDVADLDPDDPTPDFDDDGLQVFTLADAFADDDLPAAYALSDAAIDLREQSVSDTESDLARAADIVDDAANAGELTLDATYGIRDDVAAFTGIGVDDEPFAGAASVVLADGPAAALSGFDLDASGAPADADWIVDAAPLTEDSVVDLEGLTGFDAFRLGGSHDFDPETPGAPDLFLPDDADLDVIAESGVNVALGDGGQNFFGSTAADRVIVGEGDDWILGNPETEPAAATTQQLTSPIDIPDPIIDPGDLPGFHLATNQIELGAGGRNTVVFGEAVRAEFVIDEFELGDGDTADRLDFSAIADGVGLTNPDGEDASPSLDVVVTNQQAAEDASVIAFADGDAADATEIEEEFDLFGGEFGSTVQVRNADFEADSQLLFLIADGDGNTNIWYWDDAGGDGDGIVDAGELTNIGVLAGVDGPADMTADNVVTPLDGLPLPEMPPLEGPQLLSATEADGGT